MTSTGITGELDAYLLERIRRAMYSDPRVGEPAIRVFAAGGKLWLEGSVASDERRVAAQRLVEEIAPGVEVRNEIDVLAVSGPTEERIG